MNEMRLTSIRLVNFRGYVDSDALPLGQVNVLVGANNAGKSSLLRAAHGLQVGNQLSHQDVRLRQRSGAIIMQIENLRSPYVSEQLTGREGRVSIDLSLGENGNILTINTGVFAEGSSHGFGQIPNIEPNHFIVPFYSRRKASAFSEETGSHVARTVPNDLSCLAAKLTRLGNEGYPGHAEFKEACTAILGNPIFTVPGSNGQQVGSWVDLNNTITLPYMGDGVPHILGMLAELAVSEGKLFLMEEPENDLHPRALKALLDLIIKKSAMNQFLITTHSNIVVRHLASLENSYLYRVSGTQQDRMPVTSIEHVEKTPEARFEILRELGYDLSDYELNEGWLILEESSAQSIIKEFLIPMFAPALARLCLVAANGVDRVRPVFDDFHRLVLFTHLQTAYRNAVWVLVDGDEKGIKLVTDLRTKFSSWQPERFSFLTKHQFERYYPAEFSEKIEAVLAIEDEGLRRKAKKSLLTDVIGWLRANHQRARCALETSAADVIVHLKRIELDLLA